MSTILPVMSSQGFSGTATLRHVATLFSPDGPAYRGCGQSGRAHGVPQLLSRLGSLVAPGPKNQAGTTSCRSSPVQLERPNHEVDFETDEHARITSILLLRAAARGRCAHLCARFGGDDSSRRCPSPSGVSPPSGRASAIPCGGASRACSRCLAFRAVRFSSAPCGNRRPCRLCTFHTRRARRLGARKLVSPMV